MRDDWLARCISLTTKNIELEEVNAIVGSYSAGVLGTSTGAGPMESEHNNTLGYPMEMMNNLNHG